MLSSGANRTGGDDSTMPGDYQSFPGAGSNLSSPTSRPMVPTARTAFPQVSSTQPAARPPTTTPFPRTSSGLPPAASSMNRPRMVPSTQHVRTRRHRKRSLTPDIVIESRSRHRSSHGRRRVIRIPLDNRPTLGLRCSSSRVVEIERIPCRRRRRRRRHCHRRSRSVCYDIQYDDQPPVQPVAVQPTTAIANPIANSLVVPAQTAIALPFNNIITAPAPAPSSAFLSNLTQEMIDSLPRKTVHLPPLHLPGSQADANTELHTVLFPAEIINPVDGSLSIIQGNPEATAIDTTHIQPSIAVPTQSNFAAAIRPNFAAAIRPNFGAAIQPNVPTAMQPQLVGIPRGIGMPTTATRPTLTPQMNNDQLMQRFQQLFQRLRMPRTEQMSPTPNPALMRPTLTSNSQFDPTNNIANDPPIISTLNTTNATAYTSANMQPLNSTNPTPYRPPNMTSYSSANITPSRPSSFTPSILANNQTYRPASIATSHASDIGPYARANITPYGNATSSSSNNPLPPMFGSSASIAPSSPFSTSASMQFAPNISNNYMNPQSLGSTFNQTNNSTPKSILRNTSSADIPTTTYNNIASPNAASFNDTVSKTTRFA